MAVPGFLNLASRRQSAVGGGSAFNGVQAQALQTIVASDAYNAASCVLPDGKMLSVYASAIEAAVGVSVTLKANLASVSGYVLTNNSSTLATSGFAPAGYGFKNLTLSPMSSTHILLSFRLVYYDDDSEGGQFVVLLLKVSGTTVTIADRETIGGAEGFTGLEPEIGIAALSDTVGVCVCTIGAYDLNSKVLTRSGDTISAGATATIKTGSYTGRRFWEVGVCAISSNKAAVVWRERQSSVHSIYTKILDIAGTTVTGGTEQLITTGATGAKVKYLDSTRLVVGTNQHDLYVVTFSGSTISAVGAAFDISYSLLDFVFPSATQLLVVMGSLYTYANILDIAASTITAEYGNFTIDNTIGSAAASYGGLMPVSGVTGRFLTIFSKAGKLYAIFMDVA